MKKENSARCFASAALVRKTSMEFFSTVADLIESGEEFLLVQQNLLRRLDGSK